VSETAQLLLLLVSWVLVALVCHFFIRRYFLASLLAATASVLVTLYAGHAELGHLDPVWYLSSLAAFLMAGIVALVTGLPFRILRTIDREDA
jgi:hypothetical protein